MCIGQKETANAKEGESVCGLALTNRMHKRTGYSINRNNITTQRMSINIHL